MPDTDSCDHLPALSEPTLTLHCTKCNAWLHAKSDETFVAVPRKDATRGVHSCPRCRASWIGDDDWCHDCDEHVSILENIINDRG